MEIVDKNLRKQWQKMQKQSLVMSRIIWAARFGGGCDLGSFSAGASYYYGIIIRQEPTALAVDTGMGSLHILLKPIMSLLWSLRHAPISISLREMAPHRLKY